jgi:hypothetical protein
VTHLEPTTLLLLEEQRRPGGRRCPHGFGPPVKHDRPPFLHFSQPGGHVVKKANHRLDPVAVARHEVGALDDGLLPLWAQTP